MEREGDRRGVRLMLPLLPLGPGPLEPEGMRATGAEAPASATAAERDDSNIGGINGSPHDGASAAATLATSGPEATSSQGDLLHRYPVWLDQCRCCLRHVDACICGD